MTRFMTRFHTRVYTAVCICIWNFLPAQELRHVGTMSSSCGGAVAHYALVTGVVVCGEHLGGLGHAAGCTFESPQWELPTHRERNMFSIMHKILLPVFGVEALLCIFLCLPLPGFGVPPPHASLPQPHTTTPP